ncbi:MAG TPA: lipid-binding SYLF domain-containing protein [Tepidisphaeraceae bacterium]|nr:lipid-binding SYLF domain-containing protein [Tepidisphaeraceae bacterium]
MRKAIFPALAAAALAAAVVGCDTNSPQSPAQQAAMKSESKTALQQFEAGNPSIQGVVDGAVGYVIFPDVGKAAVGIGGAHGNGEVYQNGQVIGHASLDQASIGLDLGGKTYAELIVFQNQAALDRLKEGKLTFGGTAAVEVVKAGAAVKGEFVNGVRVFVLPKGGLEADVSLNGQKIYFHPSTNNVNSQ